MIIKEITIRKMKMMMKNPIHDKLRNTSRKRVSIIGSER